MTTKFYIEVDKQKVKKCIPLVTNFSRLGIVEANYDGTFGTELNISELNYLYDHFHNTASDLTPELFPKLNGIITYEKSKNFWGDHWDKLFGENGERWGIALDGLRDVKNLYN